MGNLQSNPSSSIQTTEKKYEVFLNFRGVDTRAGFTNYLYEALLCKSIETFRDEERIPKGDEIGPTLLKAIRESKVSVVIFSKKYASSKWCLRELVEIMECKEKNGQTVIPVFYKVDVHHVRRQEGSFKNGFDQLVKKFEKNLKKEQVDSADVEKRKIKFYEETQKWRQALEVASRLKGWHVKGYESEVIAKIVKDIWEKLMEAYKLSPCDFKGELFGIEERLMQVKSLLCLDKADIRIIGIWGMGGLGKTTVANAIFQQISNDEYGKCFINVRKRLERCGGLVSVLKQEVLSIVLNDEGIKLDDGVTLPSDIKERLYRKKVFIVLDDMDNFCKLQELPGGLDRLGPGSRIVITTRNKDVLCDCQVNDDYIYQVQTLSYLYSHELFCRFAFQQDYPPKGLNLLVDRVVNYAAGNPLALEVLGSSLNGKSKQEWESALDKLQRSLNPKIHDVMKISYDGLDHEDKDIFLDIACFFEGKAKDYVAKILGDCSYSLSVLISKSLVTVSGSRIQMHDLLQEMGHEIVREESPNKLGNRSRLWKQEDALRALKNNDISETVRGIFLDMSKLKDISLNSQVFEKMKNLRYLKFYHSISNFKYISKVHIPDGLNYISDELRSFQWYGYPLKVLPSSFDPKKLVELVLPHSNVEQLWEETKPAPKLRRLILYDSPQLTKIPDLSDIPLIEKIHLYNCKSLLNIHSSIRYLNNLHFLNLRDCENLRSFPSNIHFEALECLDFSGCINLNKFPQISGNIRELYLCGTGIKKVPSSIQNLNKLVLLDTSNCNKLKRISTSICTLKSLKGLILQHCENLRSFASNIHFETLEYLDLRYCINFNKFPQISGNVERLYLCGTGVEEVPSSIQNLNKLVLLDMSNCKKLKCISTSICTVKSLIHLDLKGCSELESFPEILEIMECWKILDLSETAIKELPSSIEHLNRLQILSLSYCKYLETLPSSLCNLNSLTELNLSHCWNLEKLPENLGCLRSLMRLSISGSAISQLPSSIACLENLEKLSCVECRGLTTLPPLSGLRSLKKLTLNDCNLTEIPKDIGSLSSLENLELSGNLFETLPKSIKQLSRLKFLILNDCNMLQSLTNLPLGLLLLDAMNCKQLCQLFPDTIEFGCCIEVYLRVVFTNCLKLNHKAVINCFEGLLLMMKVYEKPLICRISICVPGSEIPAWFSYQSSGSPVNIRMLRDNWVTRKCMGFALCAVLDFEENCNDYKESLVQCWYQFETSDVCSQICGCEIFGIVRYDFHYNVSIRSDHILLGYVSLGCQKFSRKLEMLPARDSEHVDLSFEFKAHIRGSSREPGCKVKCCAVHPIYAEVVNIFGYTIQDIQETSRWRSGKSDDHDKEVEPHPKRICTEANRCSQSAIQTLDPFH